MMLFEAVFSKKILLWRLWTGRKFCFFGNVDGCQVPGMLERVQLVQRVPVMLFDADSAATIKDCMCTAFEGCKIDGCKLSLHHVELVPFRRW